MLQEQIERYNDRIREYQDKPRAYRNQERGVTDSDLDVKRRLNYWVIRYIYDTYDSYALIHNI